MTYTLAKIAERWNCSHSTVLSHVRRGTLRALDISTNPQRRSHYVVTAEALDEFEASREVTAPAPPTQKRSKVRAGEVVEFIS